MAISFTSSGLIAQSSPIYLNNETVSSAKLTATGTGSFDYYLTAKGDELSTVGNFNIIGSSYNWTNVNGTTALQINPSGSAFNAGLSSSDNNTYDNSSMTLATWFIMTKEPNVDANNNWRNFARKGTAGGAGTGWDIVLEEGKYPQWSIGTGSTNRLAAGNASVTTGEIAHWAFTYSHTSGVMTVYKNGLYKQSKTSSANPIIANTNPILIGVGGTTGDTPNQNGYPSLILWDTRLYNRSLTQTEISNVYSGNKVYDGLVIRLPLDESSGTVANNQAKWEKVVSGTSSEIPSGTDLRWKAVCTGLIGDELTAPITYYKLDETSGTAITDSIGLNNGTNSGCLVNQTGKLNTCYYFDGSNDYCYSNANTGITGAGTWSMGGWFKIPTGGTTNGGMIALGVTGTINRVCSLQTESYTTLGLNYWGSNISGIALTGTLEDTWQHLIVTYDGTNLRIYQNGTVIYNAARTLNLTDAPLVLGRPANYGGQYNKQYADEIGLWNIVLTPTEIDYLYNSGTGRQYSRPSSNLYSLEVEY